MKSAIILRICSWVITFGLGQMLSAQQAPIADFISEFDRDRDQTFRLPFSHTFQLLVQTGDTLSDGNPMPTNPDFSGYIPAGSGKAYLAINSEFNPGGVTILDIQFDPLQQIWQVDSGHVVDFSGFGAPGIAGTINNCSGGITPWGTMVTCEERVSNTDENGDGYFDWGWAAEVDPTTRKVIDQDLNGMPDKLWSMGHFKHENIAVSADGSLAYLGEDLAGAGYLFKWKATTAGNLATGELFALKITGSHGIWVPIPNATAWERNHTDSLAKLSGATPFDRVEDVEIGPDGRIYFASTTQGRIFRFRDLDSFVSDFEVYVDQVDYAITTLDSVLPVRFQWPDNLAFDQQGNLWVTQDGGDYLIWVIGANHSPAIPKVTVFAQTPLGCEPTGITFDETGRYLCLSLQHPDPANTTPQGDAIQQPVTFNRGTTVVVARKEWLGSPVAIDAGERNPFSLMIAPNPATTEIMLHHCFEKTGNGGWKIWDVQGKMVKTMPTLWQKGCGTTPISTNNLIPGPYWIQLWQGDTQVTQPFIILPF